MPPRAAKRIPAGPGKRRGGRGGERAQREVHPEVEEQVKVEKPPAAMEVKEETFEEKEKSALMTTPVTEAMEEKAVVSETIRGEEVKHVVKSEDKGVVFMKKDEDVKESVDEYEKGERLDLEDNDPEYEPEEYGGVDYDVKEIEHEEVQEEGGEVEEDPIDGEVGEEEEGGPVEEEIEDVHEENEADDEDERGREKHVEMVDHTEEDEHHELFKERRKRKEFEVFVGGLDKDATEDDLRKVFKEVGEVVEVRLMMNPQTKKNKGFAFLRFATVEQAKRACSELRNPVVHGKQCGVTPSQDSDTLFLGNICKTWTKEALREKLKQYGVDNIDDLTLMEDGNNEGMNRGFAFLEFTSRSDAMDAFKRLQKREVVFGVDRPAKVSFADSFIDPGDEIMAQVKTVFVDGLPSSWDEDRVRELLKDYGEIEKVELARNMPSAKRKDFGFVTFNTHDAAVTCAKSINNEELGEGGSKAKVRARLSRPLQRGKGKHVPRGDYRHGRPPLRPVRSPWSYPVSRSMPVRGTRGVPGRLPPVMDHGFKRTAGMRDRRSVMSIPPRARPLAPPPRSYNRRPPAPSYPKGSLKRDYVRREELLPPRSSRALPEYSSRVPSDRRMSYRDDYSSRGSSHPDMPRGPSRAAPRRDYVEDGYGQQYERPLPAYREARGREFDSVSGSKRPYTALDDVPPRYADPGVRHSRARVDYELGGSSSQYGDTYGDRLGRSNLTYSGSRSSISSQDSHGLYSSRQGMNYSGGSYNNSDGGGMYSSGFDGDYMSRSSDQASGSSYSSLYSSRSLGGSSYMGSGGSSSYY